MASPQRSIRFKKGNSKCRVGMVILDLLNIHQAICICLTTSRHHLIIVGYRCSDYFLQRRGWKTKAFTNDGFKSIYHLKQDYTKNHLKQVIFCNLEKFHLLNVELAGGWSMRVRRVHSGLW